MNSLPDISCTPCSSMARRHTRVELLPHHPDHMYRKRVGMLLSHIYTTFVSIFSMCHSLAVVFHNQHKAQCNDQTVILFLSVSVPQTMSPKLSKIWFFHIQYFTCLSGRLPYLKNYKDKTFWYFGKFITSIIQNWWDIDKYQQQS